MRKKNTDNESLERSVSFVKSSVEDPKKVPEKVPAEDYARLSKGYCASLKKYLNANPPNYCGAMESLLELLYYAYIEYDTAETPKLKRAINPLCQKLRSLAHTEVDSYLLDRRLRCTIIIILRTFYGMNSSLTFGYILHFWD